MTSQPFRQPRPDKCGNCGNAIDLRDHCKRVCGWVKCLRCRAATRRLEDGSLRAVIHV